MCNCDSNDDSKWLEDSGYLTDKTTLPATRLQFGDTGSYNEEAYFTLGPIECFLSEKTNLIFISLEINCPPPLPILKKGLANTLKKSNPLNSPAHIPKQEIVSQSVNTFLTWDNLYLDQRGKSFPIGTQFKTKCAL